MADDDDKPTDRPVWAEYLGEGPAPTPDADPVTALRVDAGRAEVLRLLIARGMSFDAAYNACEAFGVKRMLAEGHAPAELAEAVARYVTFEG